MIVCRRGITRCGASLLCWRGALALLALALQGASVVAAQPTTQADDPAGAGPALEFTSPQAGISREGFVSIEWSEHPGAFGYRLIDGDDTELYRGPFAKAFVSGLPDGEYVFFAAAIDESGSILARTAEPYRLTVQHWSLRQAWILFSLGLIVFLALVAVLWRGAHSMHRAASESQQRSTKQPPEVDE